MLDLSISPLPSSVTISPSNDGASQYNTTSGDDYAVWLDERNEATSGIDIYGYDYDNSTGFDVTTSTGDQSFYQFNGEYVLYTTVDESQFEACEPVCTGLYLYDIANDTTTTITTAPVCDDFYISTGSNPVILWSEVSGSYWNLKYRTKNSSSITTLSNTSSEHMISCDVTPTRLAYYYTSDICDPGIPCVYKISNSTEYQLDIYDSENLVIDSTYALWCVHDSKTDKDICGAILP